MPRVKHAFRIILAGNVVSLCDRYPGFEHVVTHDADVTCKSCIKEMSSYRQAARTRALHDRAKRMHALKRFNKEGYAISACGFEVGSKNVTKNLATVTCKDCLQRI